MSDPRIEAARVPFTFEELLVLRDGLTLTIALSDDELDEVEILRRIKARLTLAIQNSIVKGEDDAPRCPDA